MPHHDDHEHFQEILTDLLAVGLVFLRFPQQRVQIGEKLLPGGNRLVLVVEQAVILVGSRLVKCETDTFDPERDVFERAARPGHLRMRDMGIDDDEIVLLHVERLGTDEKPSPPAKHIEELGKMVGMRGAVPVSFVFGRRDIQQAGFNMMTVFGDRIEMIAHVPAPHIQFRNNL